MLFAGVDTSNIDHDPNMATLSTKSRAPGALPMAKQTSRPATRQAVAAEGLGPYHDSLATAKKKGFVEIRRMVYNQLIAPPYQDDQEMTEQQAIKRVPGGEEEGINAASLLHSRAPEYSFQKSKRSSNFVHSTDLSYTVDDASVRRHRPVCFMPRSERASPGASSGTVTDVVYNVRDTDHKVSCNIGKQISRETRDKRFVS
jgi:hypothetical protein